MHALGVLAFAVALSVQDPSWSTVAVRSTMDGSDQAARWYAPAGSKTPAPLLVFLHTWSGDYRQASCAAETLRFCADRGWMVIQPNFRGPNVRPEACASDLAVQDVRDAVAYARKRARVDERRIYAVGTSGGGHMALAMAARAPGLWAGVSSWVPVTDLAAWHGETKKAGRKYWKDLEKVCGGPPRASPKIDAEYRKRSPLFYLSAARGVAIDLNVGIHDGHTGSIPVSHSLRAFNVLAGANDRADRKVTEAQILHMRTRREVPLELAAERVDDSSRRRRVLFRREAGPVRLTVFDGSHEGEMKAALTWLAGIRRDR